MKDGTIKLGDDFVIKNSFTISELMKIDKKYYTKRLVLNGRFESFQTGPVDFYGKKVIPTMYFEDGRILRVALYLSDSEDGGWNSNTEDLQRRKLIEQDALLSGILKSNPPYDYRWGTIESVFDPRSGVSQIIISYK